MNSETAWVGFKPTPGSSGPSALVTIFNGPETVSWFVKWGQPYVSGRVVVNSERDCVISLPCKGD